MAKLEIENLQKQYSPKVMPVKDISLTVDDGEFLTLLGPSGCGKSTLLRLIAGLESPTGGRIILGGKNLNRVAPARRNIAMVFQSYALYPHMSAAENIATSLKLRKIPPDQIQAKVMAAAQQLDLETILQRKPAQLSGGQRQRVALARAIVRDPQVFLLDEPLSNLDALLREQVRSQLKQLFEQQQKPVVYVTHDQTEAMTLSSKVAVLADGLVQQLDTPVRIYTHPANQFVAAFVGSPQMNLLTLVCKHHSAILGNTSIPLPPGVEVDSVVLGIRPEAVQLAPQTTTEPTVQGKIYLIEELGKERLISVEVESGITIRALIPIEQELGGETVSLCLPESSLHWFEPGSGNRL